jgi:hypothetical protein
VAGAGRQTRIPNSLLAGNSARGHFVIRAEKHRNFRWLSRLQSNGCETPVPLEQGIYGAQKRTEQGIFVLF